MTKKLLLLILALPLILMISLFTTTNTVSLAISVPVTGVEYIGSKIVYLSLDEEEKYEVNYAVYPTNAQNQEVTFTTEAIGEDRLAKVEFEDNYIIPKGIGTAKVVITTKDGGFQDSFIVQIDSDSLQEIESTISKDKIYVGEKSVITTEFIPAHASNQLLSYTSSNESVAKVDEKGFITGVGKGTATITIASVNNESIYDTVEITVLNKDIMDLGQTELTTWNKTGSINVSIDTPVAYVLSVKAYDANNYSIDGLQVSMDKTKEAEGQVIVNYEFTTDYVGIAIIEVKIETELGLVLTKTCEIKRVNEIQVSFDYDKTPNFTVGQSAFLFITVDPYDANVLYDVTANNENVSVQMAGKQIMLVANKPGVTTVKVRVTNAERQDQYKEAEIDVVVAPKSITIEEFATTYGIENVWTVGKEDVKGNQSTFSLHASFGNIKEFGEGFYENVTWTSSSDKVTIDNTGKFQIKDSSVNEIVTFTAHYKYSDFELSSASFAVRCVGSAVNVYSYLDLYEATSMSKEVVLHNNIKEDFGYDKDGNVVYKEINTTYDDTYYKNIGSVAKVKILLDIKNNVYGNGYEINAHNIVYGLDETGALKKDALFRGPLNFVACAESGVPAISVKGQDNIVFAVYENVCLNNVQLKGCDLEADSNGNYDLVDLTYAGTTVEVFGDNVEIKYSRISNGRMILRIFGDINDSSKVINVNISNSILSSAREFIIRMGSNCFIDGTAETPAPLIDNVITEFPVYQQYSKMNASQKAQYDSKYIKTFVNVKNTAFRDSGIFSIGIDSHFAGGLLADGANNSIFKNNAIIMEMLQPWYNLAKTSYGAKLTFEGDVRIYDWKDLALVDSSSLIDINQDTTLDFVKGMKLDISAMVRKLSEEEAFKNIIVNQDDKEYVHGGIAFFGGGKNYGTFEMKNYDFYSLNGYKIALSDAGRAELEMAAGEEEFYFLMHDKTTLNFSPKKQSEMLASGEAYNFVYPTK